MDRRTALLIVRTLVGLLHTEVVGPEDEEDPDEFEAYMTLPGGMPFAVVREGLLGHAMRDEDALAFVGGSPDTEQDVIDEIVSEQQQIITELPPPGAELN
jgi:hypothetical protein